MAKGLIGTFRHPGGRPSKYDEKIVLKLTRKYIDDCEDSYERVLKSQGKRSVMYEHRFTVKLPMLEGLALVLHVHKDTIHDWRKKYAEFSYLIDELLSKQAIMLANKSLSGLYNPTIAKVLLTKHGYREGHELANPDGSNMFRPDEKDRETAARALKDM